MRAWLLALAVAFTGAASAQDFPVAKRDYLLHCSGCHRATGEGAPSAGIPAFANSVAHIAATDLGRTYLMHVPGIVSAGLPDRQTADVVNYVLDVWGDQENHFTPEEVAKRRAIPVEDVVALRREVATELEKQGKSIADYPWP